MEKKKEKGKNIMEIKDWNMLEIIKNGNIMEMVFWIMNSLDILNIVGNSKMERKMDLEKNLIREEIWFTKGNISKIKEFKC